MHGRKREEYKAHARDPVRSAALAAKAEKWHALVDDVRQRRSSDPSAALAVLDKLVALHPDPITLWNYRRELLGTEFDLSRELATTQAALQANPKAYPAWLHRKWAVASALQRDEPEIQSILESELALTAVFLQRDERNFHCWNYRRFLIGCQLGQPSGAWVDGDGVSMGAQLSTFPTRTDALVTEAILEQELAFTAAKIADNFSNFSAFHYRAKLLALHPSCLDDELELIESAVFTEPDDQTAWWYQRFVLDTGRCNADRLNEHLVNLRELSEESPSKWVLMGILNVLEQQDGILEERRMILERLIIIDPDRQHRYRCLLEDVEETSQ